LFPFWSRCIYRVVGERNCEYFHFHVKKEMQPYSPSPGAIPVSWVLSWQGGTLICFFDGSFDT
jgi:hypothetical protein